MKNNILLFFLSLCTAVLSAQTVGTIQLNDALVQEGYTLVSPLNNNTTYLIDHCGAIINRWDSAYPPGNDVFLDEQGNLWRAGRPTIEGAIGAGGRGGVIELFNWEGSLIWSYERCNSDECLHHDFELLPNGNLLLLIWDKYSSDEAIAAGANPDLLDLDAGVWSEYLEEISPNLEEDNSATTVWQWYAWDHLIQDYTEGTNYGIVTDHPEKIDLNYAQINHPDWLHANALDYNADKDEVIISIPHFNEFWIVDHNTTTEQAQGELGDLKFRWGNPEAYDRGTSEDTQVFFSHNAHRVDNDLRFGGDIIFFNNQNMEGETMVSAVDVISPAQVPGGDYGFINNTFSPEAPTYRYLLPDSLASNKVSGVQVQENGNLLICSGVNGTVLEITEDEEIAWHYILPINDLDLQFTQGEDPSGHIRWLFRAYKYTPDFSGFEGKDLIPGFYIELGSEGSFCEVNSVAENTISKNDINLYPNPVESIVNIDSSEPIKQLSVYNTAQQVLLSSRENSLDLSRFSEGVYFIEFQFTDGTSVMKRVIKN